VKQLGEMSVMELFRPGNDINDAEAPTKREKGGSIRRWMVVAGSMTSIWATYGLLASNGVLLSYWTSNQLSGLPHSSTAWINGVHLFLTLFLGSPIGIIFDKHGSNILMITGSVIYLAGIFGMAESSQFWHFMVTYGILGGTGCSILSTVAISVLGHWFDEGKGLATGIVMLGGSLGGVMFPLVLRPLFEKIGWSWSIRALGLFITVLVALGLLSVRSRKSIRRTQAVPLKSFLRLTCVLVVVGIGGEPTSCLVHGF
jgi:MFS family permease